MRLVFTTDDYVYGGVPRPGLPLLLDGDMQPAEPFQSYLHHRLLGVGKALDRKTWEAYGRRLWDYVRYLDANELAWDVQTLGSGEGPVASYRDWSRIKHQLEHTTINSRLAVVVHFYEWAYGKGLIKQLPFGYVDKVVPNYGNLLAHLDAELVSRQADVMLSEWEEEPAFLTREQLLALSMLQPSPSRRLLVDLMSRVGLRSCEARTFPLKYVFNPATRVGLKPGQMIEVKLKPRDMDIKFGKPRIVHVPYSLMEEMWAYTIYERNRLKVSAREESSALLLTVSGGPYSKDAVADVCATLSKRVGFKFTALMLRHSYAIHTLVRLRARPDFEGEPLLYVRDRLGHKSVQTTTVYLRQIERLSGAVVLAIQAEFDNLFETAFSQSTEAL